MSLSVPLRAAQIAAAARIFGRLVQWQRADCVLKAVDSRFPDFGPVACLLKCVAVNSLYGTNVYAIMRMAEHVEDVMKQSERPTDRVELVEKLAKLPAKSGEQQRNFVSFASKFAHFFIRSDVPIYDSFAEKMLKLHLGRRRGIWNKDRPYASFMKNLQLLRAGSGLEVSDEELDHYLWIAGQLRAWERARATEGVKETTNRELAEFLREPPAESRGDWELLRVGS
jgi:hypothetical protein